MARQNRREREAGDKNRHANPLRGREAEVIMEIGIIAAEIFNERTRNGVAKQISRKNLAVEFFASEQPSQKNIKCKVQQSIVNFGRMDGQRQIMFTDESLLILLPPGIRTVWKANGPRQSAHPPVATAVE